MNLLQADDTDEMQQYLRTGRARTDAMMADSDLDGLPDDREVVLSTNPNAKDTDGDGIPDGAEVHKWETDPTLHDYQPPRLTIHQAGVETDFGDVTYRIIYSVSDPSGVRTVTFRKLNENVSSITYDGVKQATDTATINTERTESILDDWTGASVNVDVTDVHGSSQRELAYERPNLIGQLAKRSTVNYTGELASEPRDIAYDGGLSSGFTASLGSSARGIKQLAEDPLGFISGLKQIAAVLQDYGLLEQFARAIAEDFVDKQETNNPYDPDTQTELYDEFEAGYYIGYAFGEAGKIVGTAGAGNAVRGSTTASKLDDILSSSKGYRILKRVKTKKDLTEARLLRTLVIVPGKTTSATLRGAKTVGAKVKVWRVSTKSDLDTSDLSDADQRAVGRFVAREGDDGARVLADGGDDAIAVISRFDDVNAKTVDRLAELKRRGELSERDLNRLERSLDRGAIDGSDLRQISLHLSERESRLGDRVAVGDLIALSKKYELERVKLVTKDESGDTIPLLLGNVYDSKSNGKSEGWVYLENRHIEADLIHKKEQPAFGRWVKKSKGRKWCLRTMKR